MGGAIVCSYFLYAVIFLLYKLPFLPNAGREEEQDRDDLQSAEEHFKQQHELARHREEGEVARGAYQTQARPDVGDAGDGSGEVCDQYAEKDETKIFLSKIIEYYENIKKSRFINFRILKYFKYLGGRNLLKKMIKELIIFHFPVLGYLIFIK